MKVHLTTVYRATQDKKGNPFISKKTGKPYVRLSIKTIEHGEQWLSGFGGPWNENWQQGEEVDIVVKENGQYLNFDRPNLADAIASFERRLSDLEKAVFGDK